MKSQWKSYSTYKFILWAWMMNEVSLVFAPVDMSHNGFYIHGILHAVPAIIIGIPLIYSEVCVAQYSNSNVITMWDFFPLFRCIGYGTIYLVILKTLYVMVLTSWYLEYTFYAALDPPPWYSCDEFKETKCMVKRINVSIFQHCIEAQNLFDDDCGMKTASRCFFDREIGDNNTLEKNCVYVWKMVMANFALGVAYFILFIKIEKCIKVVVRCLAIYVGIVIFVLFCVALSSSGTWYATKITMNWSEFNYKHCFYTFTRGALSCGTGCGIIGFLSRDVSFRSPATMTSVTISLFSVFISLVLGLIIFSGIKTMSYYHGEEESVLEMGESMFFTPFASVSEIMSYFESVSVWGFLWFALVFFCLFMNLWILILFLNDILYYNIKFAQKYSKVSLAGLILLLCLLSCPFYCSDLASSLADTSDIIQLISSFFFSFAIYWVYGYKKHNIDIIFMIGVKASWFWKLGWMVNPILLIFMLYIKVNKFISRDYENTHIIKSIMVRSDSLLSYSLVSIYILIIFITLSIDIHRHYLQSNLKGLFFPTENWGPRDKILFRSRSMFVPEIMTREFLYRQVRIRGYGRCNKPAQKKTDEVLEELSIDKLEWSALTSN
ncbi:sodium-dependent noradrenaline transporter-like [Pieris brassicae]|uniref:sodium-dependent noradrenaline transporter-like n=1 Tax=Pieris brassicae TaxID=7116 RepID=UPI001E66073B|nr:sodium-dependent noradrenaline transporter-like [Pieris brassicae]